MGGDKGASGDGEKRGRGVHREKRTRLHLATRPGHGEAKTDEPNGPRELEVNGGGLMWPSGGVIRHFHVGAALLSIVNPGNPSISYNHIIKSIIQSDSLQIIPTSFNQLNPFTTFFSITSAFGHLPPPTPKDRQDHSFGR